MRLFVALEIPETLRAELERRAREVGRHRPPGGTEGGDRWPEARWLRAEAMHLTLSFLGETDPEALPRLHRGLEAACSAGAAFELRLHGLGAFPPRGKARVLWTGFADGAGGEPPAELAELQKAVAGAVLRGAGVTPERRPFHPHLTLARLKPPWGRGSVERFLEAFGEPPEDVFRLTEGVLFESEPHPSGARYRALGRYPLAGGREEP